MKRKPSASNPLGVKRNRNNQVEVESGSHDRLHNNSGTQESHRNQELKKLSIEQLENRNQKKDGMMKELEDINEKLQELVDKPKLTDNAGLELELYQRMCNIYERLFGLPFSPSDENRELFKNYEAIKANISR